MTLYGLAGLEDFKIMILKLKSHTDRSWLSVPMDFEERMAGFFAGWKPKLLSVASTAGWSHKHDLLFPSSGCCFSFKTCEVWTPRAKGLCVLGVTIKQLCFCVTFSPVSWLYAFTSNVLITDLEIGKSVVRILGLIVITHTLCSQEWSQQAEHSMF